jgi:hypothetical protein
MVMPLLIRIGNQRKDITVSASTTNGSFDLLALSFVLRKRLVVSHFHDDIGNLFSKFPGDHLDRHFLILNGVVQQMSTGWRAVRELLELATPAAEAAVEIDPAAAQPLAQPCPCCGGRMFVIETFDAGCQPRYRPTAMRIDTS